VGLSGVGAATLARWADYPPLFVREVFGVTPDPWQDDVLEAFPHKQRIAMLASKGPGKTGTEAWCAWNFLLTRPDPNIAAVSITAENLADNLWKEMAKWQDRSPLLQATFEWKKQRIECREKPATWWMSARSWPRDGTREAQANSLAGLHADYVMFILDESGGIPDAVLVSAEAALATCIEGHILQGGNPTQREGSLFRAHQERDRWHVIEVNGDPDSPTRSPRVSEEWARDQIRAYGRENPWVLVNVFGQFPPTSLNTLIGSDEVTEATKRSYRPEDISRAARVLGIDVAFEGDDASVMFPRQGLIAFSATTWRGLDGIQGAGAVAFKWDEWGADACFVDDTGGFGRTWIDNLRLLGKAPIGVGFAEGSTGGQYANKRAEMYFNAIQWIRQGGQLPPMTTPGMPELCAALSRTTYTSRGDRLLLEPKKIVKEKLGYSPDHADAFVLTFAHPVSSKERRPPGRAGIQVEWDPFREVNQPVPVASRHHASEYDPYR
jgi:phage terminase large subunit